MLLEVLVAVACVVAILMFVFFQIIQKKELIIATLQERNSGYEQLKKEHSELQQQLSQQQQLSVSLQTKLSEQEVAMQEKIKLFEQNAEHLKAQFKNIAGEILEHNSKKFAEQNRQSLGVILDPVKVQLGEFKKKVEDVYIQESKDRSALQMELKILKELNQKMSEEAHNLTKALKHDVKKQGNWGEMVLERVLESSGLRKGFEYEREVSLKDDQNNTFRPDVVVNLPDNRHIIIDAKTSLIAYKNYISSDETEEKKLQLHNHLHSLKEHIKHLSEKKYENLQNINSLDFIFLFVPIEGALLLALEHDTNLYDFAFKQKIILVSPTTLLVALRAVENSWRYEKQAQNISEVYDRATKLYDKIYGFVQTLHSAGKAIKKADNEFDKAVGQLSEGPGNVIRQIELLKEISNIKPKKEIDEQLLLKSQD